MKEVGMSLFINQRDHWQISGGGELHSGDLVEVYAGDVWLPCRVDFRPKLGYVLRTEDGRELEIHPELRLRFREEGLQPR
jgi:hypothetical protein